MLQQLERKQFLPIDLDTAWNYFSTPYNLATITPDYMNFNIKSNLEKGEFYPGMVIEYTVSPIAKIPLPWVTEITQVVDGQLFVDEQRFGPYAFWHHLHQFKAVKGGVEMLDLVHYKLPLWLLGKFANKLFVRRQLEGIFDYRQQKLKEIFDSY